ncbi:MAG: rhomboid family intramembrane serine protease [Bacteroidota bacterium]|uniref:Rhomboid family intramembrane serine protease n=1 Tax=Flagellimonas profundi TaxID=2915620 RepID=A0ABS3FEJ4_9FLAO|nr:rhomboid family intramembrane serine protease [Allomuricauda profundi]MBD3623015.1 rhomboid family intramembrane serine protease [Sunxiuqinia sp.]MBO0341582.1 rhomboid family intramembrane serine protease [Allomuricauda profundi]MEC7771354.1 rhomboid family intramembrane serine protease [Bacteroidota bacterium]
MMNGGLRYQFARLSIAEKLIAINVLIFLIDGLSGALFGYSFSQWFLLPKDFFEFLAQPWSLVTYSFFHAGFGHIFWNMLVLYFAGRIFLNLFDSQRFINVYFLGLMLGGLVFLLSYNVFPTLVNSNTALIGASAGVNAVLIFVCTYIPNREVRVIFFNVKLWYIGVALVVKDLVLIGMGDNIGGGMAHLGGAFLGYMYARQLFKGNDIGSGFTKLRYAIADLFKPKEKKAPMKTVYRKKASSSSKADYDKKAKQKKIDSILDKISKSGYESLSKEEKDFLFKAGKED